MSALNDFLRVPYLACGRDMAGLDCWGLVCRVMVDIFNKPPPTLHADIDKTGMHSAYQSEARESVYTPLNAPEAGCIAACYINGLMSHVGVVVVDGGRMMVLHTRAGRGCSLDSLAAFDRLFDRILWWRYGDN